MKASPTQRLQSLAQTPPFDWPEDARPLLLGVLRDRAAGEDDRVLAAELSGCTVVHDDEVARALLTIAESEREAVLLRSRAVIALGPGLELCETLGFDDPADLPLRPATFDEVQQALRTLYADPDVATLVRRKSLEASVRAPQQWHPEAVRAAFASADEEWRLTAVFGMRFVEGFEREILQSLDSPSEDVQAEAMFGVAAWAIEAAWPRVLGVLQAKSIEQQLLLAAIEAVGALRPAEAEVLLAPLAQLGDEAVDEAVAEALAMGEFDEEGDDEEGFGGDGPVGGPLN
jgi:hypothetical protein